MSDFSDRLNEEEKRISRRCIERLAESNATFEREVRAIIYAPQRNYWKIAKNVLFVAIAAIVLYVFVWGILAL